jgi:beta-glucanase (GH16 family)
MLSRRRQLTLVAALAIALLGVVTQAPGDQRAQAASGAGMPGNFPHWKQTFADDFTGNSLNPANWTAYDGPSKSSPISIWTPDNVVISGGVAHLLTKWNGTTATAAGISSAVGGGQAYGKWVVRMRSAPAAGVNYVVALYPVGGGWPPEVDFAENGGGVRDHILATLHYSPENLQIHKTLTGIDFTQWHTVGVITSPGHIEFTVDGRVWAQYDSAGVPSQKMWLTIQTGITPCTAEAKSCANDSTPAVTDTQVDWVARYVAQ